MARCRPEIGPKARTSFPRFSSWLSTSLSSPSLLSPPPSLISLSLTPSSSCSSPLPFAKFQNQSIEPKKRVKNHQRSNTPRIQEKRHQISASFSPHDRLRVSLAAFPSSFRTSMRIKKCASKLLGSANAYASPPLRSASSTESWDSQASAAAGNHNKSKEEMEDSGEKDKRKKKKIRRKRKEKKIETSSLTATEIETSSPLPILSVPSPPSTITSALPRPPPYPTTTCL